MKRFWILLLVLVMVSPLALAEDGSRESEYARAVTLVEQGAYEEAATIFAAVIQHKDAGLYYMYCTAFFALEIADYPLAEESFALLAEVGFLDSDVMVLYAQARALEAAGSHDEAIALYKEVLVGDSLTRALDLQRRDAHAGEGVQASETAEEAPDVENVLTVAAIEANVVEIPARAENAGMAPEAVIEEIPGDFQSKGEVDKYTFVPEFSGTHRFEAIKMDTSMAVNLTIYDGKGERITSTNGPVKNGNGLSITGMKAGEAYEIQVKQHTGMGSYVLSIGCATPVTDISGLTAISDSTRFEDQSNHYVFTPEQDGLYEFELSGISGATYYMFIYNPSGERIWSSSGGIKSGGGVTLADIEAGRVYEIYVSQHSGLSDYTLTIGHQKPTRDVSAYTAVSDQLQYGYQVNRYDFTPALDGRYCFYLYGIGKTSVRMYAYNQAGEEIAYEQVINGQGITLKELVAGETYRVSVKHHGGDTSYQLDIGHQKPMLDITDFTAVEDSIQYTDQRNRYVYNALENRDVQIEVTNQPSGMSVTIEVYNPRGELIAEGRALGNGKGITFTAAANETYDIRVFQNSGTGAYTLRVQ